MNESAALLLELDKLKSVYRKSYVGTGERNENSAEHSWHLAVTLMALRPYAPESLNLDHAIRLALTHDICEIGAGDTCAYRDDADRPDRERAALTALRERAPDFGEEVLSLWAEYENQQTLESRWVRVVDKLLPFLLNLANEGRTWQEQSISARMVRDHNAFIADVSPQIHAWMMNELDGAIAAGWVAD